MEPDLLVLFIQWLFHVIPKQFPCKLIDILITRNITCHLLLVDCRSWSSPKFEEQGKGPWVRLRLFAQNWAEGFWQQTSRFLLATIYITSIILLIININSITSLATSSLILSLKSGTLTGLLSTEAPCVTSSARTIAIKVSKYLSILNFQLTWQESFTALAPWEVLCRTVRWRCRFKCFYTKQ